MMQLLPRYCMRTLLAAALLSVCSDATGCLPAVFWWQLLPLLLLLQAFFASCAAASSARGELMYSGGGSSGAWRPVQRVIISAYSRMPLNALSRAWGRCHRRPLPHRARAPLFRLYSRLYNCDLSEARYDQLSDFASLAEFFARDLRPGLRPVCSASDLVSPVDGRVLSLGRVRAGHLEQVKGVTYSLQGFLGPQPVAGPQPARPAANDQAYIDSLRRFPATSRLYHCVIYLAPGDYHKFHSPADWLVRARRHFPGRLLSVAPSVAARVADLFAVNERAAYVGAWRHGFMSLVAVGATGVGSISVDCDPSLSTNQSGAGRRPVFNDCRLKPAVPQMKGQLFGQFNLGSTIVLLFEAPVGFRFLASPGEKVRVGQGLGA